MLPLYSIHCLMEEHVVCEAVTCLMLGEVLSDPMSTPSYRLDFQGINCRTGTEVMHDLEEACKDVDIAVLLSGISPKRSHEDFVQESRAMYSLLGRALNDHASENVKVGASTWHASEAPLLEGSR